MNNDIKFLNIEWRTRYWSQIMKTIFELDVSVIFRPQYVWFLAHLYVGLIPKSSGQLAERRTNCLHHSTTVDLYSHQILFMNMTKSQWVKTSLIAMFNNGNFSQGWGQFLFFNSIPIPIPLRSIPIPIPIPLGWKIAIPIPIPIPFYQFQFKFQFLFINSFSIPF